MTAHEIYELLVGEIGIPHDTALHTLTRCQIGQVIRGYRRRAHTQYDVTRWLIWSISSMMGGKADSPQELIEFPWEKEPREDDTDALLKMVEDAQEYNRSKGF